MDPLVAEADALIGELENKIERIIRGGTQSSFPQEAIALCNSLFELLSSNAACHAALKNLSESETTGRMNVAVRLHNKVRSFTNVALFELKARTKACAAYFLYVLSKSSAKALCNIMRLLGRACQETHQYSQTMAQQCCEATIQLYDTVNMEDFSRQLPPMELVDVKITIFQAYLDLANILTNSGTSDMERIRMSIAGAMEIVQQLPDTKKTQFCRDIILLGSKLTVAGAVEDAIYHFHTVLNCLDVLWNSASAPPVAGRAATMIDAPSAADIEDLLQLKMRAQLSLAYCFKELKYVIFGIITATIIPFESYSSPILPHYYHSTYHLFIFTSFFLCAYLCLQSM